MAAGLHDEVYRLRQSLIEGGDSAQQFRLRFELAALLGCSPKTKDLHEASHLFGALVEQKYRK